MLKRVKLVLVGGGGHCKVIIDALKRRADFEVCGFIDNDHRSMEIDGVRYIGDDSELFGIFKSGCINAFLAVGSVGNPSKRIDLDRYLKGIGFNFPSIIHPNSIVARDVEIGEGTFVGPGAVIGPGVRIGRQAIINTRASVDHDCKIGDFTHIAPGVVLSGGVEVGEKSHIGTGSAVIEYKRIGDFSLIGAGSAVVSDIPANSKAYGNPCKVVGVNNE